MWGTSLLTQGENEEKNQEVLKRDTKIYLLPTMEYKSEL